MFHVRLCQTILQCIVFYLWEAQTRKQPCRWHIDKAWRNGLSQCIGDFKVESQATIEETDKAKFVVLQSLMSF